MTASIWPSLNSICTAVKVFVKKGDTNKNKADEFYIKAGIRLAALKEELKRRNISGPWYKYVEDHCGLSQERADEYIRMAKGRISPEEARTTATKRKRKSRAKAKTSAKNPVRRHTGTDDEPWEGNHDTCDYDPTDQRQITGEPYHVTRLRGYMWATKEAVNLRFKNLFAVDNKAAWAALDPAEITDEVIQAAQHVADVWFDFVDELRRRRSHHGQERTKITTSDRTALH